MEKIDLVLWALTSGFAGTWTVMLFMFKNFNQRIDKFENIIMDIDRRVCRIEGALSSKECCMLKDDRIKQKAQ